MNLNATDKSKRKISIAYSPDTDDAFMVLALREKNVDWDDFDFEFFIADIQELNDAAKNQRYDITAISVGAYPLIKEDYLLMPIGASIGDQFGPAVVVKPGSDFKISDLRGRRIAVPGLTTTAHIAAQSLFGPFEAIPMHFMEIRDAVLNKKVDAGILIHELQMDPNTAGLQKLGDLGSMWYTKHNLPLPLGANAIKRNFGQDTIQKLSDIYLRSIEFGLKNRRETIRSAVTSAIAKGSLDLEKGDKYISMYVNERSLRFHDDVIRGIQLIYEHGFDRGFLPQVDVHNNLSSVNKE